MRSELAGLVGLTMLLGGFFLCPTRGTAQIPNAGFEMWSGGEPDGWITTNMYAQPKSLFVSNDSRTGSFAARGTAPLVSGSYSYAWLIAEFPSFEIPQRMKLHYKFLPEGADGLYVGVTFQDVPGISPYRVFAEGGAEVLIPASEYTVLDIPVQRVEAGTPAYCRLVIGIEAAWAHGMGAEPTAASSFVVDDLSFEGVLTSAPGVDAMPGEFRLGQNYPNPFNPSTMIQYDLPVRSLVTLAVFNSLGQQVATLVQGEQAAGYQSVVFDATGLSSGVYFYRITAGQFTDTKRFVLTR